MAMYPNQQLFPFCVMQTLTPSVWRCCLARDFPSALAATQARGPASAAKDGHSSEGEDWRQLYKLTRLDAERERKRKAEEAERRRRQTRRQFPHRPEIHPGSAMPQPLSGGGNWGIPGRNPLMAGGDYDRMPHLPAVPVRLSLRLGFLHELPYRCAPWLHG
jgi:hypothetical protein